MNILSRFCLAFRYFWTGEIPLPDDGRPMHTDLFLAQLLEMKDLDAYDRDEAVSDWCHGDWGDALCYLAPDEPALTDEEVTDIFTEENPLLSDLPMKPARKAFFDDRPTTDDEQ